MARKNRDSKFVIYQVLYIFVITVLAIKGANLDLGEVISKKDVVRKSVRDSLLTVIDSLNQLGIKFNLSIDDKTENVELKKRIASLNQTLTSLSEQIVEPPIPLIETDVIEEEAIVEEDATPSPLSESQQFIQNTWNIASNKGNIPVQIKDPQTGTTITTVSPGEQKKFDLGAQKEVLVKFGNREERIKVTPNKPPEIRIEKVSSKMNTSEIYVQDLQRTSIFKVTILDERPEQLNVTFNGPISASGPTKDSKGNLIYNVALRIASNEQKFDEWMDRMKPLRESDGRYKINFFFVAQDKVTKERIQVGDSFYFTEFEK